MSDFDELEKAAAKKGKAKGARTTVQEGDKVVLDAKTKKEITAAAERAALNKLNETVDSDEIAKNWAVEGRRRWVCIVRSTRPGIKRFELTYPHPENRNRPVLLEGFCGVPIKEGLNTYVIKQLQKAYHMQTDYVVDEENPLQSKQTTVRMPSFNVEVLEEIKEPKEVALLG